MAAARSVAGPPSVEVGAASHAVLVLVGRVDGRACVLLTRRSQELSAHAGEIGLPGGRAEAGETVGETAIREAAEETGIDPASVEVLGSGPTVRTSQDGVDVVPVFARWISPHPLQVTQEAEEILLVPVSTLVDGQNLRAFEDRSGRRAWAWVLSEGLVWGFTALVVELLLDELVPGWAGDVSPAGLPPSLVITDPFDKFAGPVTGHAGLLIADQLRAERVDEVCVLIGGHISPILDGCASRGVRLLDFRHEAAAVHAADGLARLRRRPAVAAVTAGPGVTNAITAVANAWYAQSPVVLLTGRNPLSWEGMGSLQDAPHVELLRPVTKRVETAYDGYRLPELLHWSMTAAIAGRPGPTALDLPLDVQLTQVPVGAGALPGSRRFTSAAGPDPEAVAEVAALLTAARHPVIMAGSGAYWSAAEQELALVAERLCAPVYCNGLARGLLPPQHPSALRLTRSRALGDSDVVLIVGADLDFRLGYGRGKEFRHDMAIVHVSPDASTIGHNRPIRYGVTSEVRPFLAALLDQLTGAPSSDWLDRLTMEESRRLDDQRAALEATSDPIHPLRLVGDVARYLDQDAVMIVDGGDIATMAASVLSPALPGHWLDPGPFGCLGVGIPFAIAARVAHPGAQVLAVVGDGAFGFNALELDSAVRQQLPFVVVVGNDGAWGEMRTFHEELFGPDHPDAQYLSQATRYDLLARSLGGHGERVEHPEDIIPALDRAFASGVPAVVDVVLDPAYRHRGSIAGQAASLRRTTGTG